MKRAISNLTLLPLGDQAVLAYLPDESAALRFAAAVRRGPPLWVVDVVQAYTSVAVFYDLNRADFQSAAEHLQQLALTPAEQIAIGGRLHQIPCCYELHLDLDRIAAATGMAAEEVIRRHSEAEYTVYAIGFCPGFPYLGYLPPELCGVGRLPKPRLRVEVGSVGLTGRQTGIYTEARPAGWNIVGRTPLQLVDVAAGYFPLRTGDRVRFVPIDPAEFDRLLGQRLEAGARSGINIDLD
jgi:inhibitor of KinA